MDAHRADLWHVEDDVIRCELCPHACRIKPGNVGVCGVRRNEDGTLIALTYARVSSAAIDPIEKKPVFHYHPGTLVFSIGSVGCTMRCGHCQNWQISRATVGDGMLHELPPESVVSLAERDGCAGVAFTYNEPVIQAEYVRDTARLAHEHGLYTVMVTNGYIPTEGPEYLPGPIDGRPVHGKGKTARAAPPPCPPPPPGAPFRAAERAKRVHGMHVEVVTNVVPTVNDDEAQLTALAEWIATKLGRETPWHITRFFPYLDFAHLPPTPLPTLRRAREIGRDAGLHYVYLGNVSEPGGEDTMCPGCGATLLSRDGFEVVSEAPATACASCGRPSDLVT